MRVEFVVGAWSVYPFFKSGTQIVQSIEKGLFVLKVSQPKWYHNECWLFFNSTCVVVTARLLRHEIM